MSEDPLQSYPVTVEIPIQWGELDAYGHLNNTVYFRHFESVRVAYFERIGLDVSYERDRIGGILHSTSCRFRRPLYYPDTVRVGARTTEIEEDRFTMAYRIVSRTQEATAADGTGVIVCYDYDGRRKTPLPRAIRERIAALKDGSA